MTHSLLKSQNLSSNSCPTLRVQSTFLWPCSRPWIQKHRHSARSAQRERAAISFSVYAQRTYFQLGFKCVHSTDHVRDTSLTFALLFTVEIVQVPSPVSTSGVPMHWFLDSSRCDESKMFVKSIVFHNTVLKSQKHNHRAESMCMPPGQLHRTAQWSHLTLWGGEDAVVVVVAAVYRWTTKISGKRIYVYTDVQIMYGGRKDALIIVIIVE